MLEAIGRMTGVQRFVQETAASLVTTVLVVSVSVSFAGLIFAGDLSAWLHIGIALALLSAAIQGLVTSFASSFPATITCPQDKPAAILGMAAAGIAVACRQAGHTEQALPTTLALVGLTTLATGAMLLALGSARLGGLIRFLPYPVVGGFLAGTGWLIFRGTLAFVAGPAGGDAWSLVSEPSLWLRWGPALVFGAFAYGALRRTGNLLTLPAAIVLGIALFYAVAFAAGAELHALEAEGWLVGPLPEASLYQSLPHPSLLADVDWSILAHNIPTAAGVALVATLAILLNSTGIELSTQSNLVLDRELSAAGAGNLVSGLFGGLVGYSTLSLTLLNHRSGITSRRVGVITGLACGAVLIGGASALAYFPRPVVGGLLFLLAIDFLVDWLWDERRSFSHADYAIVWMIVLSIAFLGFLTGVGLGLAAAIVLFVVRYSAIPPAKGELTLGTLRSNVSRPPEEQATLDRVGDRVPVIRLRGFLFFGTAHRLLSLAHQHLSGDPSTGPGFLILDFRLVPALDSSAVLSLRRIRQLAEARECIVCVAGARSRVAEIMRRGHFLAEDERVVVFEDLDRALEWCEQRLLADAEFSRTSVSLAEQLRERLGREAADRVSHYLERVEMEAGQMVFREGEPSDALYFVESGRVSALVGAESGGAARLRAMGSQSLKGGVFGEMGIYRGKPRSASVIADEACVLYRLSRDSVAAMERDDPKVASAFHRFLVELLADRLSQNTRALERLLE